MIDELMKLVGEQMQRKSKLYDGINSIELGSDVEGLTPIVRFMFSVIEEIGEVSSAITRHRYELAKAECIDVAHSALLLYLAIEKREK